MNKCGFLTPTLTEARAFLRLAVPRLPAPRSGAAFRPPQERCGLTAAELGARETVHLDDTMSFIHMYSNATTDVSGTVVVDVPADGEITAIEWSGVMSAGGPGSMLWQLSFANTPAWNNDQRQVISMFANSSAVATEHGSANSFIQFPKPLKVMAGERLYLHCEHTGTAPTAAMHNCLIHIDDKASIARVRR